MSSSSAAHAAARERAYELHLDVIEGAASLEELCRRHPELTTELRAIDRHYRDAQRMLDRGEGLGVHAGDPEEVRHAVVARLKDLAPTRDSQSYSIEETLFAGGMGEILRVRDRRLGRDLAMKRLPASVDVSAKSGIVSRRMLRFLNEAQIAARLAHPSILDVHDAGVDARGRPYFTMPLVNGRTFTEVIVDVQAAAEGWSLARALAILLRICEALAYAHSRDIVHRDVKPSNVLVGRFGETYLVDWGLAKVIGEPLDRAEPWQEASVPPAARRDSAQTLDGDVVGTPAYMAPEQAAGRLDEIGPLVDVYSVGATLYHLCTGRRPYDEGEPSPEEVLERLRRGPPEPVERYAPKTPPELLAITTKAMARDPDARYPSMGRLASDLQAYLDGRVVDAHRTGAWAELSKWMRRHRAIVVLSGLLMAVLVGASVIFGLLYRNATNQRRVTQRQLTFLRQSPAGHRKDLAGIPTAGTFSTDLRNGRLDPPLRVFNRPDLFDFTERGLELHPPGVAGENSGFGLDDDQVLIRGDFELGLEFEVLGDPRDGPVGAFGINVRRARDGVLVGYITYTWADGYGNRYDGHTESDWSPVVHRMEPGRGGLRVARSGSTFSAQVWDHGWRELYSAEETREAVQFFVYYFGGAGGSPVLIDEISLEAQGESPLVRLDPVLMTFAGDELEYFTATGSAGVTGIFEGRLFIETFADKAGDVTLGLDRSRCVLFGDFSVEFEYEFIDWNEAAGQSSQLAVTLSTLSHIPLGISSVGVTPSDAITRASSPRYGTSSSVERPSNRSGRLRVARGGSTVVLQHWDGQWQTLLSFEEEQPELGLQIGLTNPSVASGATVAIDDLRIEGLHARW